jgi:hypothetical protein
MKKFFLLYIIMLSFNLCFSYTLSEVNEGLTINVIIIKKIKPLTFYEKGYKYFSAKIELANTTDSVISLWIMSCSWEDNFFPYNNAFRIMGSECDYNAPKLIHINPGDKIIYNGIFYINDTVKDIYKMKYKIGFVKVKEKECEFCYLHKIILDKRNKNEDIIWSNEFRLKKGCGKRR